MEGVNKIIKKLEVRINVSQRNHQEKNMQKQNQGHREWSKIFGGVIRWDQGLDIKNTADKTVKGWDFWRRKRLREKHRRQSQCIGGYQRQVRGNTRETRNNTRLSSGGKESRIWRRLATKRNSRRTDNRRKKT